MTAIGAVVTETEHRVMAPVEDAKPREVRGRRYHPQSIQVIYKRSPHHGWRAGWISLYGPQIRQDGSTGTREVDETLWTSRGANDPEMPVWAWDFYVANMPADGSQP